MLDEKLYRNASKSVMFFEYKNPDSFIIRVCTTIPDEKYACNIISETCLMYVSRIKFFWPCVWGSGLSTYLLRMSYSTTYHSRASECLQNIKGTDYVVFVLISFPQMSNILLQKFLPLAQPQISNKIMCPYYPYVVL